MIARSPEPSHVALPLTAPEMLTLRGVASFAADSAKSAVAALPETLHESMFPTGLYLKASLWLRAVSTDESLNHTCLAAFAVPAPPSATLLEVVADMAYAGTAPKDTPVSFVVTLEAPPMTFGISQPIFTYAVPGRALPSNVTSLRVHSPAGTLKYALP